MSRENACWRRHAYTGDHRHFDNEQAARFGFGGMSEDDFRNSVAKIAARLFETEDLNEKEFLEIVGFGFVEADND